MHRRPSVAASFQDEVDFDLHAMANPRATAQPIPPIHPRSKFTKIITGLFRLCKMKANIVGIKYDAKKASTIICNGPMF
jgi:hypothetical protein